MEASTSDNDYRLAFDTLKISSAAIEKHAKVLDAQRAALLSFRPQTEAVNGADLVSQRHAQESGRLMFALDDVLHSTKEQLREAEQASSEAISKLSAAATERLAADDQILEALSCFAVQVLSPKEAAVKSDTAEKWCRKLASMREEEVKARVETIINDEIVRGKQGRTVQHGPGSKRESTEEIQDELQTLQSEIGAVVQMVIDHQISEPLLRNIQSCESHVKRSRLEWSEYVTMTLEHLIAQLETTSDQAIELGSYSSAIFEFRPLLAATEAEATVQRSPLSKESPLSPTESSNRSKFLESRSANTSAVPQVLRRLNNDLTATGDRFKILEVLDTVNAAGTAKLRAQYTAAEKATLENLEKSLGEKQRDIHNITRKIYSDSGQDHIQLSDKELDSHLQKLNCDVDQVAAALEKANLTSRQPFMKLDSVLKTR